MQWQKSRTAHKNSAIQTDFSFYLYSLFTTFISTCISQWVLRYSNIKFLTVNYNSLTEPITSEDAGCLIFDCIASDYYRGCKISSSMVTVYSQTNTGKYGDSKINFYNRQRSNAAEEHSNNTKSRKSRFKFNMSLSWKIYELTKCRKVLLWKAILVYLFNKFPSLWNP
jgi:outer membrane phospholipase A